VQSCKDEMRCAQGAPRLAAVSPPTFTRERRRVPRILIVSALGALALGCGAPQRTAGRSSGRASRPPSRSTQQRGHAHVDDSAVVSLAGTPTSGRRKPMQLRMARPEVCRAWTPHARRAARAVGLSTKLLLAIAWVESGFRTDAISSAGARGPMQLMPRTSHAFGCDRPERPACAFPAAAALMRRLLSRFDGRVVYALCAYNAGAGRIRKSWRAGKLPFNVWYAERVLAAKARLERHGCRGQP